VKTEDTLSREIYYSACNAMYTDVVMLYNKVNLLSYLLSLWHLQVDIVYVPTSVSALSEKMTTRTS